MADDSLVKSGIAGAFGGVCLVSVGYPLDTLKTKLQVAKIETGKKTFFKGYELTARILSKEGVASLYRGVSTPLIIYAPTSSVFFLSRCLGTKLQKNADNTPLTPLQYFNAGMFAGAIGGLFGVPYERIKCLLQAQGTSSEMKYRGGVDCLRKVYKEAGFFRGLFRGSYATLCRDVPAGGVLFMTYELLKDFFAKNEGVSSPSALHTVLSGGLAGCAAWVCTMPIDTIKSRYQIAPMGFYPNGVRDIIAEIHKKEGLGTLYRGITPVIIRSFPSSAACFIGFETARKMLYEIAPDL